MFDSFVVLCTSKLKAAAFVCVFVNVKVGYVGAEMINQIIH